MSMYRRFLCCATALLAVAGVVRAEVRLPGVFGDHAVLQRQRPIHVWGWASPGARITVSFHDQTAAAVTDKLGNWSAWLKPEKAGGPYVLKVDGDGTVSLTDILVGDVWVASGQSNMQFPLSGFEGAPMVNSAQEIAAANHPNLRLLVVPRIGAGTPQTDVKASWTPCVPGTAASFSAVAYFFGREIAEKEDVPVGLIDSTWGGTPVDAWISMDTLGGSPAMWGAFHSSAAFIDGEPRRLEQRAADDAAAAEAKAQGKEVPPSSWYPDPVSWAPAGLYNGMIAPLTPLSVKGFLWYQGESDTGDERSRNYATHFSALIEDWRARFAQGDLPFLFVQISVFASTDGQWGVVRDAQRRTLKLRNTAMVVSIDVGNPKNVHPADKQTVGARLALAARAMVYGEKVDATSPSFRQVTTEGSSLRVWFDHAQGLSSRGPLTAFEVAGEDRKFVPATATIDGETVVVQSQQVAQPMYVRYAWANADMGSLFNAMGLPAGTFTSEDAP